MTAHGLSQRQGLPQRQGLYDPRYEHDACGLGFVVDLAGRESHRIVQSAVEVLLNLEHRSASVWEKNTGDGAGLLLQIPHGFLARECDRLGVELPPEGQYAAGIVFLPVERESREQCEEQFEEIVLEEGQRVLGWRTVPTDDSEIGPTAKASMPLIRQIFGRVSEFMLT